MRRPAGAICALTLFAAACGRSEPPPAPAATSPAPTTAAPAAPAPAPAPDTTAPAEPDTAAPAPPADGLAPEVAAALASPAAGCVGAASDGSGLLVLFDLAGRDGATTRLAHWISTHALEPAVLEVGRCERPEGCPAALAQATTEQRAAVLALAAGATLAPCQSATLADGAATARPHGQEVVVRGGATLSAAATRGRSATLAEVDALDDGEGATLRLEAVAWSEATGAVAVLASRVPGAGVEGTDPRLEAYGVGDAELGVAPCRPRPSAAAAPRAPAPPFEPDPLADEGCVAMTPDGRAAFIATSRSDSLPGPDGEAPADGPTSTGGWYGPGAAGAPALECLFTVNACPAPERAAALERARAAGLAPCPARTTFSLDGAALGTLESRHNRVWLTPAAGPPRWVDTLAMARHDGGDHESLEEAYQHPAGGPVFLFIRNEDTGLRETRVRVLDEAALGFCPPAAPAPAEPAPAPAEPALTPTP